jgi:hypothetical protein
MASTRAAVLSWCCTSIALAAGLGLTDCNCSPEAPPGPAPGSGTADAGPRHASSIVVAESRADGNPAYWGGVLQYALPTDGGDLTPLGGIDAGMLRDPLALTYRPSTAELFVSNRHGGNAGDGVPGSISRFLYSSSTHDFTPNGTITGNSLNGVCQVTFSPLDGELFAANAGGGVSRFRFVDGGAVPNGTIADGTTRGVLVSRNGLRLYVTSFSNSIRQFDLSDGGAELAPLLLPGGPVLHFFASFGEMVYVGGYTNGQVYRLHEADDGALTLLDSFPASDPVSVAIGPGGLELYTSGHQFTDVIQGFAFDAGVDGGVWVETLHHPTGFSLGGIELLP